MNIAIFRTVAHRGVWEQSNSSCVYSNRDRSLPYIIRQSPAILAELSNICVILGIYSAQYYREYGDDVSEQSPSLLIKKAVAGSGEEIRISFGFIEKISMSRDEMLEFDRRLLDSKQSGLSRQSATPLCFTLDGEAVNFCLRDMGIDKYCSILVE